MTRIFGLIKKGNRVSQNNNYYDRVRKNFLEAVRVTYVKGWHAYGVGVISVNNGVVKGFSELRGYRGITPDQKIENILPFESLKEINSSPEILFIVLQNEPDEGEEAFLADEYDRKFPIESNNWFLFTIGRWWNEDFNDEKLPWYDINRPSRSLANYLETNPKRIDFSWVDSKRIPFIVAVRKDGQKVIVVDNYSKFNDQGRKFLVKVEDGVKYYDGIRDSFDNQV